MQKFVYVIIATTALVNAMPSHAQDGFYAGLATGASKANLIDAAGKRVSSSNHPVPLKAYAGFNLNQHFAIEAGHKGTTGKYTFDKDAFGTSTAPQLDFSASYLAAKGTMAVGESVDLFAKLGVAYNQYRLRDAGTRDFDIAKVRPMLGVGAAFKFNDKFALTLEMEHFGVTKEKQRKFVHQSLQAGVKYSF